MAIYLAAGCGQQKTGVQIEGACQADLAIAEARSSGEGPNNPKFTEAVQRLASQAPPDIEQQVQIVTDNLLKVGEPADSQVMKSDENEYLVARQEMDSYLFEQCSGLKQSIVALDKGYESLSIATPAGPIRFRISNGGEDDHQIVILTKAPGVSGNFEELLGRYANPPGANPVELLEISSANARPGGTGYTTAALGAGDYLVACLIRQGTRGDRVGTGPAYYERGMQYQFTIE